MILERGETGRIYTQWYQKSTSSGRIILVDCTSNHTMNQKIVTAENMIRTAERLTDDIYRDTTGRHIDTILRKNYYSIKIIKQLRKPKNETAIMYMLKASDSITYIFGHQFINWAQSPIAYSYFEVIVSVHVFYSLY